MGWLSRPGPQNPRGLTDPCHLRKGVVVLLRKIKVASCNSWWMGGRLNDLRSRFQLRADLTVPDEFSEVPTLWSSACLMCPVPDKWGHREGHYGNWWSAAFYLLFWGGLLQAVCCNSPKEGHDLDEPEKRGGVKSQSQSRQRQQNFPRGHFQVHGAVDPKITFEQKQG